MNHSWCGHPAGPVAWQPTGARAPPWGATGPRAARPWAPATLPPASPPTGVIQRNCVCRSWTGHGRATTVEKRYTVRFVMLASRPISS